MMPCELERVLKGADVCQFCGSDAVEPYSYKDSNLDTFVGIKCMKCGRKSKAVKVLSGETRGSDV